MMERRRENIVVKQMGRRTVVKVVIRKTMIVTVNDREGVRTSTM